MCVSVTSVCVLRINVHFLYMKCGQELSTSQVCVCVCVFVCVCVYVCEHAYTCMYTACHVNQDMYMYINYHGFTVQGTASVVPDTQICCNHVSQSQLVQAHWSRHSDAGMAR